MDSMHGSIIGYCGFDQDINNNVLVSIWWCHLQFCEHIHAKIHIRGSGSTSSHTVKYVMESWTVHRVWMSLK